MSRYQARIEQASAASGGFESLAVDEIAIGGLHIGQVVAHGVTSTLGGLPSLTVVNPGASVTLGVALIEEKPELNPQTGEIEWRFVGNWLAESTTLDVRVQQTLSTLDFPADLAAQAIDAVVAAADPTATIGEASAGAVDATVGKVAHVDFGGGGFAGLTSPALAGPTAGINVQGLALAGAAIDGFGLPDLGADSAEVVSLSLDGGAPLPTVTIPAMASTQSNANLTATAVTLNLKHAVTRDIGGPIQIPLSTHRLRLTVGVQQLAVTFDSFTVGGIQLTTSIGSIELREAILPSIKMTGLHFGTLALAQVDASALKLVAVP